MAEDKTQPQQTKNSKTAQPLGSGRRSVHGTPTRSFVISPEVAAKHTASVEQFPDLNLSPGEYVIQSVRRHPIGLLSIWIVVGFLIIATLALLPLYSLNGPSVASLLGIKASSLPSAMVLTVPDLILAAFFTLGGFIATIVYEGNHFYLTNESVIQHVRPSLFHTQTQIINLVNIEDASFDQRGILQQVLNYGTIRLSTQGQETIYHFYFVANPARVVNAVNDAVELAIQRLENGGVEAHIVTE